MAIDREIWNRSFSEPNAPNLPCPNCRRGKLKLAQKSFFHEEPKYSKSFHVDPDWEPDWISSRWSARLICDEDICGEIVHLAGDSEMVEGQFDEYGDTSWTIEQVCNIRIAYPAPPLFPIPNEIPWSVKKELRLAFGLYWADNSASVSRLRTAVEAMLDDQKVPRKGKNKKGDIVRLDLFNRIDAFAKNTHGAEAREMLHALRNIGNLGTHGDSITGEELFDVMDVFEDVLLGIYAKKSIKAKAKKLSDKKSEK